MGGFMGRAVMKLFFHGADPGAGVGMAQDTLLDIETAATLSVAEVQQRLGVTGGGISEQEAGRRLELYGANVLQEHRESPIIKFLGYFWGPIPWMIEIAAVLSALVQHWSDFSIIVLLLVINAVIGFYEEYKADISIQLLKKNLALRAQVLRDGQWLTIAAAQLVPGDLTRIRLGDIVPADLKLLEGEYLEVDQSSLTGESLPVAKAVNDILYSGSIAVRGEMTGVVVATGMHTYYGKTADLVQQTQGRSHYQEAVLKIGHFLIISTLVLVGLIILLAMFRGDPMVETLQFALILTIAAIPVALPAVLSVTMAVGAVRLSRHKAIVSRLVSIEEMAGMDVLCSDKTGTLTQNRLVLGEPIPYGAVSAQDIVDYAALASRAGDPDPIDRAIFERAESAHIEKFTVNRFVPFDPVIKRTEASILGEGTDFKVTKGAPQVILELSANREVLQKEVNEHVNELARRGYRTLAVAKTDRTGQWHFLGILPMLDPPREDSAATIEAARELGIDIKMVTGDHLAIAREISQTLNLGDDLRTADELLDDNGKIDGEAVEATDGFAQVFPEHKYQIVESLQQRGHIVGMTGDGVNDAPALKKADMGIAVSGAIDAARSAADLVLTAPGLSVIIEAIKESRKIFERMNSYAIYRIAESFRVLLFMSAAIMVFNFYPVTAIMIILLALLNDGPIMMIAYDNARLNDRPVVWDMRRVLTIASILGVLGVFSSFGMFWIGEILLELDRSSIQTLMFLKLTVAGHMTIYLARSGEQHFWVKPYPAAALFWTCELTQLVATLFAVYGVWMAPIGWGLAALIWAYSLAWFVFNDFIKVTLLRLMAHKGHSEQQHLKRITTPFHP